MFKRWLKRIFWTGVVVFVAIQFVPLTALQPFMEKHLMPVTLTNPPVVAGQALSPPPPVEEILRVACYDCHSNETRWPWYAHVAPMSWGLVKHVTEGRAKMDFSTWGSYPQLKQADFLRNVKDAVDNEWMPLSSYLLIHRDAILTPEQVKTVADWAGATAEKLDPVDTEPAAAEKPITPGGT